MNEGDRESERGKINKIRSLQTQVVEYKIKLKEKKKFQIEKHNLKFRIKCDIFCSFLKPKAKKCTIYSAFEYFSFHIISTGKIFKKFLLKNFLNFEVAVV